MTVPIKEWNDRKPYTYLIGWSIINFWYYGSRYAKGCHPNDLFKSYFTSSKIVKDFVKKYGCPDVIKIRKVFDNPKSTITWETKFLTRIDAANNPRFLNLRNNSTNYVITESNTGSFKKGQISRNKGRKMWSLLSDRERKNKFGRIHTEEERLIQSQFFRELYNKEPHRREIARQKNMDQFNDPFKRQRHKESIVSSKGTIWVTNGIEDKRILKSDISKYSGYTIGRTKINRTDHMKYMQTFTERDLLTGRMVAKQAKENNDISA